MSIRAAPKAICFDLDDTLLDGSRFDATVDATCQELAARIGDITPGQLLQANWEAFGAIWNELSEPWTLGKVSTPDLTREIWRRALSACGCADESLVALAYDIHTPLAAASVSLFEDAMDLLDALDVPLAIITNGASDLQREKLEAVGIAGRFQALIISGEHGVAKPDGAIFARALTELGVEPGDAWHIGDNLHADVGGANAAGLTSVWINRDGAVRRDSDPCPDHEVDSLAALARLLG